MYIPIANNRDLLGESSLGKHHDHAVEAGLIDRRRFLHIFHDERMGDVCKVIQVNISTTRSDKVIFESVSNRNNGTLTFMAVYVYSCKLPHVGGSLIDRFKASELTILSAKRLDRDSDYDLGFTRNDVANLYSCTFNSYEISEYVETKLLVDPRFYTQEHEYAVENDVNPGIREFSRLYGLDIVDDVTTIYLQHPKMFDTINDSLLINDDRKIMFTNAGDLLTSNEVITDFNYITGCDYTVNGGVFAYDSQLGVNFKNSSVIGKRYMAPGQAEIELENVIIALRQIGKVLEDRYGSVRLMYSPSIIGSKCRIIYKDYDNQQADSDVKSSADSSYEVTEVISQMIDEDKLFVHNTIIEGIDYGFEQRNRLLSYC